MGNFLQIQSGTMLNLNAIVSIVSTNSYVNDKALIIAAWSIEFNYNITDNYLMTTVTQRVSYSSQSVRDAAYAAYVALLAAS